MTFRYPKRKFLYDFLSLFQSWAFPIIFVYLIKFNNDSTFWFSIKILLGIVLVIGLFTRLLETVFTRVEFMAEGAHVYTGVFSKQERFIPKEKFENIQTSISVIQKLFGAAAVTMETGDAAKDLTITFAPKALVPELEAYILSREMDKQEEAGDRQTGRVTLFTPSLTDLWKASIVSFSFLAIFPIVFSLWEDWEIGERLPFDVSGLSLWLIVFLVICFVIIAVAFGVFRTFNAYYKYDISMDDDRIYVKKGWLSKQSFSIRKEKVQAVIYKQSLYQRLLKVTTIRLISTGEILASEDEQINEFFPYLPTAKAKELAAAILPEFVPAQPVHRLSRKAKPLIYLRPPVFSLLLLIGCFWHWAFYILAGAAFVYTYISRYLHYTQLSFAMDESRLQITSGSFEIETIVTRRPKLIEMEMKSSSLQRRFHVMSIQFANRAEPVHISTL